MANLSYNGLFEGWEVAVAKKLVYEFKEKWRCLDTDDFEDLLQDCLTHWLFAKDKYDPKAEASEKTFMGRVIRNRLNDIIKNHDRVMRRGSQDALSLDQSLSDDEDDSTLLDTIPAEENFQIQTELKIDLSSAYRHLTHRQKKLCELLGQQGLSVSRASEILKIPRTTICDEVKRIKAIFMEKRLHEYLK